MSVGSSIHQIPPETLTQRLSSLEYHSVVLKYRECCLEHVYGKYKTMPQNFDLEGLKQIL